MGASSIKVWGFAGARRWPGMTHAHPLVSVVGASIRPEQQLRSDKSTASDPKTVPWLAWNIAGILMHVTIDAQADWVPTDTAGTLVLWKIVTTNKSRGGKTSTFLRHHARKIDQCSFTPDHSSVFSTLVEHQNSMFGPAWTVHLE